jgi:hypothetical protein
MLAVLMEVDSPWLHDYRPGRFDPEQMRVCTRVVEWCLGFLESIEIWLPGHRELTPDISIIRAI